ncbi:AAA family ATPase [Rhodoferax sp. AJA081-3]|uniref:ExeA family protein n=1 Tax=Rhodoferax sp. AJA081-3 TaxID=2752316 RepID=UPI001ADF22F4|nr:ExeA family protein [Rhodoferax sp. AJA081-3]QTN26816.1 AAA family ATPase [Rhodoferax sp. AJA081-3]
MYSQHFGLTQDPFSIAPDPRYLFMSERHREALAHLLFGVSGPHSTAGGSGGGFVLLTGDIGTGKTTICRCFLEQIPAGCHVAYIFNPKLTVVELLQSICEEFHITLAPTASSPATLKDYIDALNSFLLQSHAAGQSSVLIIDEAQNLQADVLEQLRLLTNLETNARKLLQIVLIGQPELRTMLARPELEQLAQRVIARFHLDALTEAESTQYIQHRLAVAGHTGALPFDRKALQSIHRLARGVPRRINLLCGRALLGAWATGLHSVDRSVVHKAAGEVFGAEAAAPPHTLLGIGTNTWLLAGAGVLLGVAATAAFTLSKGDPVVQRSAPTPRAAVAPLGTASAAVITSSAAGSTPTSAPPASASAANAALVSLEALMPQLPSDIALAWNTLAQAWPLPANSADPCAAGTDSPLQCYRTTQLNLPLLRQLARPGILTLQAQDGSARYAVLVGLTDQTATLRVGDQQHTVSLSGLALRWRGGFATLWQPPPGYSPAARGGATGPAITHLAQLLDRLDGQPSPGPTAAPQQLDAALKDRLRDFQRSRGLQTDGQPGPMTYMQLESALGSNTPRLPGAAQ